MAFYTAKLGFFNKQDTPREIIVEPWADRYTLQPKEEMYLVGINSEEPPRFYIIESESYSQVYLEQAGSDYYILQNGRRICIDDQGESKGIEQDIVELMEAGHLALWIPDKAESDTAKSEER